MVKMRGVRGLVAPTLVGLALAACGGGGGDDEAAPAEGGAPAAGAVTENPVDAATAGNVHGTVKFAGTAPAP